MRLRILFIVALVLTGVILSSPARATCDTSNYSRDVLRYESTSLIAYYRGTDFSTQVTDCSSFAQNATTLAGVTFGSTGLVTGSSDTSIKIDIGTGTNGVVLPYTTTGPLSTGNIDYNKPFFIDVIFKAPTLTAANYSNVGIIGKFSAPNTGWGVAWNWDNFTCGAHAPNCYYIGFLMSSNGGANLIAASSANDGLVAGTIYHLGISYDGLGTTTSLKIYLDGILQNTSNTANLTSTIGTGGAPMIGGSYAQTASPGTEVINIQELAIYNSVHPAGATPHVFASGNYERDALAFYHSFLLQNNQPPYPNPATGCVVFEKDYSDVDVINDINTAVWLAFNHQWTLCAIMVNSATPPNAASATRALLDAWNLQSVPVYNYQGSGGATGSVDSGFTNAIEAIYRSQDSTNVGIQSFTPSTGLGAGTGFNAGDIFQVNGGTLASGFGAARYVVLTTGSGGSVLSARIKESGSYSTAPSGTVTTTALTGGGTGLMGTVTTAAGKGNYGNAEWALYDLINAHPGGVLLINGGQSHLDYAMAQDHPSTLCNLDTVGVMQGLNPNNAMYGAGGEFNAGNTGSEWNAFYSALAACGTPVPVVSYGVENTEVNGSGNAQWVYMGENPKSVLGGASISGTTLTIGSVGSGTVGVGDYVYGVGLRGGLKIVSGSGLSWQLNYSPGTFGSETMFTNAWDNPAIEAFLNSSTASSQCQSATPSFYWCRLSWTPILMYALQAGINPQGSGRQLYAMWGGNNGIMSMDKGGSTCATTALGDDCWLPTTQSGFSFISRTASDSVINNQNLLVANDNPSNYLPIFRRESEPGLRAGSRHPN